MYCQNCGHEVNDNADVCLNCGKILKQTSNDTTPIKKSKDSGSIGWGFLGFFFPLIGLILYLVWKDTAPNNASIAGKGALIGFISGIVLSIIMYIIMILVIYPLISY